MVSRLTVGGGDRTNEWNRSLSVLIKKRLGLLADQGGQFSQFLELYAWEFFFCDFVLGMLYLVCGCDRSKRIATNISGPRYDDPQHMEWHLILSAFSTPSYTHVNRPCIPYST